MTGETVTYSLEAVLTRIEGKLDRIDERLTKLEIGQTEIKGEIRALDERLSGEIRALDETRISHKKCDHQPQKLYRMRV